MKKIKIVAVIALFTFFYSCQLEEPYPENQSTTDFKNQQTQVEQTMGYRIYGKSHNIILSKLLEKGSFSITDASLYAGEFFGHELCVNDKQDLDIGSIVDLIFEDSDAFIERLEISAEAKSIVRQIADIFECPYDASNDNSELNEIIERVYITRELAENEKEMLLASIEVARSSSAYWNDIPIDQTPCQIGDIVLADFLGFVEAIEISILFGGPGPGTLEFAALVSSACSANAALR